MRLIPIDASGTPEDGGVRLSDTAREVCEALASLYRTAGYAPPWIGYLAEVDGTVVGTCAFKAPPRAERVEIAYFTFPGFEGRGFATCMAHELRGRAVRAMPGIVVLAQTQPQESASTSVLKRLGFQLAGTVEHPEDGTVWEWHWRAGTMQGR